MCKTKPTSVFPYLREANDYRIDECLDICQRYRITDATAWLLERQGDILAAYSLIHGTVMERIKELNQGFIDFDIGGLDTDARPGAYKKLRGILAVAIQMCLRSSERMDEASKSQIITSLPLFNMARKFVI